MVVLKELIFNNLYFGTGLERTDFSSFYFGRCGGLEITDFNSFYFWRHVVVLKRTDF